MVEFTPRNENVLVLPDEAETMRGNLYVPASAVQKITRGTVMKVGPGYLLDTGRRQALDLKEGQRIEFQLVGTEHVLDVADSTLILMKENQIVATVDGDVPPRVILDPDDEDFDEDDEDPQIPIVQAS